MLNHFISYGRGICVLGLRCLAMCGRDITVVMLQLLTTSVAGLSLLHICSDVVGSFPISHFPPFSISHQSARSLRMRVAS
jgi:hypothetical protein